MRVAIGRVPALLVALLIAAPALAQFGHPLKGTWSGDWGPTKDNRTHVVLEMNWDGKDAAGKTLHYSIDGKLENIGAYQRVITGTWTEGGKKGDFKVIRN